MFYTHDFIRPIYFLGQTICRSRYFVVSLPTNLLRNKEQGTRNKEQGTRNKEQGARNKEQGTRNKEQGTRNKELVPYNSQ